MTTKEITISQGGLVGIPDPNGMLDVAINAAKALTRVLSQKKHPVIMNNEQYLEFEDWQTLGQFYGVTVKTGDAMPVEVDGVKGAKAVAQVINLHTGEVIGGAEAYCMRDEPKWSTRPKYEYNEEGERVKVGDEPVPWFQLASMAQTRAGAKALRNRLAWIAVLGGYKPTPAEEMTGSEIPQESASGKYYCKEHKTVWFKKGKMKSFAHPIGDTGVWCHMPSDIADTPAKQQARKEMIADMTREEPLEMPKKATEDKKAIDNTSVPTITPVAGTEQTKTLATLERPKTIAEMLSKVALMSIGKKTFLDAIGKKDVMDITDVDATWDKFIFWYEKAKEKVK